MTEQVTEVGPSGLDLDVEHIEGEDTGRSVDEVLAERDAERGQGIDPGDLAAPTTAYIPLRQRPKGKVRFDPFAIDRLRQRPSWHGVAAPESVAEAWAMVEQAVGRLEASIEAIQSLGSDQARERERHEQAIVQATSQGEPAPGLRWTDWSAEEIVRTTRYQMAHRAATEAREAYGEVVAAALPAWRASLVEAIPQARAEARRAVREADQAVRSAMSTVSAARAIDEQIEPKPGWNRTTQAGLPHRAVEGLGVALAYVQSDDPVITGRYLSTGDDMSPPSWTREVLAESESQADFWLLGAIEAVDGFRATGYTEPGQRHHFGDVASPELAERLRRKDLSADSI
jgi:hypothetical protein